MNQEQINAVINSPEFKHALQQAVSELERVNVTADAVRRELQAQAEAARKQKPFSPAE